MKKILTTKTIVTTLIAVAAAAVMIFAVLPQLQNVASTSDFSVSALIASACCGEGDGGGGGGGGSTGGGSTPTPTPTPTPSCSMGHTGSPIQQGHSTSITWSTSNANYVHLTGGGYNKQVGTSGRLTVSPSQTTTYKIGAKNGDKVVYCSVTIKVTTPPPPPPPPEPEPEPDPKPVCDLDGTPTTLTQGDATKLTWSTSNAHTVSIDNGVGSVSKDGNTSVAPTQTTKYTLTAKGSGGTVTCAETITVTIPEEPKPICSLSVNPTSIVNGNSATLTWTTQNATSISIDQGIGSVAANGNTSVSPAETTTYTLTAVGDGGEVTCDDTLTVTEVPPQEITITATKIVCTDEADLPNWGTGGPDITANTAANWVAAHESCSLTSGWDFQWGPEDAFDPGDTLVGEANSPWVTFGPTNGNGEATVTLDADDLSGNGNFWLREVLKDGYIPFSYGLNQNTNVDDVSAEFYCHTDVKNFDNYDRIEDPELGGEYYCVGWNVLKETEPPAPVCTLDAEPNAIQNGSSTTLTWTTENATSISIDQGIGAVDANASTSVSPTETTTYTLTATGEGGEVTCEDTVTVTEEPPVPQCTLDASPNAILDGGESTLTWTTSNATSVSINQGIGSVQLNASTTVSPSSDTTYTLTAVGDGGEVTCSDTITIREEDELFCDMTLTYLGGSDVRLSWQSEGASSASIDQGVGSVALNGSTETTVSGDTTFTLTVSDGDDQATCQASIDLGGGGGGGSSRPRCDFEASKTKIRKGEEIELSWDNTRTSDITIEDDRGNLLVDTDRSQDSDIDEDEDSIKVKPTRDTVYTLTAISGSRDDECTVKITIEDDVTVTSSRSQDPLVAGISLSQVPYTGFEAGPMLTTIFYMLLVAWSLGVGYVLVIRKEPVLGLRLPEGVFTKREQYTAPVVETAAAPSEETTRAQHAAEVNAFFPQNLPTGSFVPAGVGYASVEEEPEDISATEDDGMNEMTNLENHAHEQNTLLSSDAMRYLITAKSDEAARIELLDEVIEKAKAAYPIEDGWLVINKERIMALFDSKEDTTVAHVVDETPKETVESSLAEAIVSGNIVAAYRMLGENPMLALADAANDLDALYRARKGERTSASDMLKNAAKDISDEQLLHTIEALTSAIDGTYSDETAAVKLAVMKAVRALT